jgi:hypothetical protein
MKTSDMITILKCEAREDFLHPKSCQTCPAKEECKVLCGPFTTEGEAIAERLEQLLINLRTTQEQLKTVKGERDAWRKRYMKLQNGLKNIVHENELLDNLMN